jgi:hypothetical protein
MPTKIAMALNSKLAFEAAQMAANSSGTNKGRREKSAGRKKAKTMEKHYKMLKLKRMKNCIKTRQRRMARRERQRFRHFVSLPFPLANARTAKIRSNKRE